MIELVVMQWIKCSDKPVPDIPGEYRVLLPGDSESVDGHVLYEFGDYFEWATFLGLDEDGCPLWSLPFSEPDEMIAFCGPFEVPKYEK